MLLDIFDPVLCCASGVCGPQVDPALVRIAADLRWVEANGGRVRRYNLGQDPAAFVRNEHVRRELSQGGEAVLPLVLVDGQLALRGRYPNREEMAAWLRSAPGMPPKDDASAGCGCQGSC